MTSAPWTSPPPRNSPASRAPAGDSSRTQHRPRTVQCPREVTDDHIPRGRAARRSLRAFPRYCPHVEPQCPSNNAIAAPSNTVTTLIRQGYHGFGRGKQWGWRKINRFFAITKIHLSQRTFRGSHAEVPVRPCGRASKGLQAKYEQTYRYTNICSKSQKSNNCSRLKARYDSILSAAMPWSPLTSRGANRRE